MSVVRHCFEPDILKLKRIRNEKMEQDWRHEPFISRWAVGLCFDFHPHVRNVALDQTQTQFTVTYTTDVVGQPRYTVYFGIS